MGSVFSKQAEKDDHAGLASGVLSHENGMFLYKSKQLLHVGGDRIADYVALSLLGSIIVGQWTMLIPFAVLAFRLPRHYVVMKYFTFHAELLPHTEQVVFHKSGLFGSIKKHYVDIANLEKLDGDEVDAELLWGINMFDKDLIFRDASTQEIFVFDQDGIWNKDTLEHKLLY